MCIIVPSKQHERMKPNLNIEIKARCHDLASIQEILVNLQADYRGEDHQIDTYYKVPNGRLKLREGNIEKALIQYHRENIEGPKASHYQLYKSENLGEIKSLLHTALGELIIVDKKRKIFYINNAKIHLDQVEHLGTFVEIEIIEQGNDNDSRFTTLQAQCEYYIETFGIQQRDLCSVSYSDMMLDLL